LNKKFNLKIKAFTLTEVLITMILVCVIMAATIPVFTQRKRHSGIDSNSQHCIVIDNGNLASSDCTAAVANCRYNTSFTCATLFFYAQSGTAAQKDDALSVVKAVCDQGGDVACDYLIQRCIDNNTLCEVAGKDYDLNYYLNLDYSDTNPGKAYIEKQIKEYYSKGVTNIVSEVNSDCSDICGSTVLACVIKGDCLSKVTITQCNNNDAAACTVAYNNNWNRTCQQIKSIWYSAPNGTYKLTLLGVAGRFDATCDMTTSGGGWTLVLNYLHLGNTNPALSIRSVNLPVQNGTALGTDESGTAAWGHAGNTLMNTIPFDTYKFYCISSGNDGRIMNFAISASLLGNYFKTGAGNVNIGNMNSFYTSLTGHSTNIPSAEAGSALDGFTSAQGDLAMTESPFFRNAAYYWGIRAVSNRWECDEYMGSAARNTFHQIWVR